MSQTTIPPEIADQAISAEEAASLPSPDTATNDANNRATPVVTPAPTATAEVPAPEPPANPDARPWHGAENPLEAVWAHFTAEIAALKVKLNR